MQKIFLVGLLISIFGFLNAAEMSIDLSEKIDISSDNIEIKEGKIEFKNNVIFRSDSFEIFGEVAEYNRNSELIKIEGSPVRFEIDTEDNIFNGFSNLVLIKDNEIEISGSVLIEDKDSRIRGKIIKFNMGSGELQIN
jgi:lipopolysaccharide export system protein LptA